MIDKAEKIVELRASTGLSQKAFSNKFRIRFGTLVNWEYGSNRPKTCTLFMLEKLIEYERRFGDIREKQDETPVKSISELMTRSGLDSINFAWKFRINEWTLHSWEYGSSISQESTLYMIEKLLDYEDKFGDVVPDPEWSKSYDITKS